jgi:oxidoreductase
MEGDEGKLRAFILGATGEVGKEVVSEAASNENYGQIVLVGRRKIDFPDDSPAKRCEQRVVDFDDLEKHADAFKNFDVGFCCLGTTRGKSGADGFVKVDHDYVVNAAKLAKEGGCKHFLLCSSQVRGDNSVPQSVAF